MAKKVPKNPWLANKSRKTPKPKDALPRAVELKDPAEEPPFYIRGQQADSKDEYWVSLALEKIEKATGWTWDYQVPLYGGRMRGGNVADFLVHTPGAWTILDPMGRYWHTGRNEDRLQMQNVARRRGWRLVAWFTDQTPSKEAVLSYLRKELHA